MKSIRARLLAILLATTGAVWLSAAVWIYTNTQAEVERVLDARLKEAARMVNSLITDHRVEVAMAAATASPPFKPAPLADDPSYNHQLSCQIWSLSGALVGRSESAPEQRLSQTPNGFSDTVIDGETWRVYAVENAALGVQVLVGDNLQIRDGLVNDVIKGLLLPLALIVPFAGALIWFSVRRGLSPLDRMAEALSGRSADDLRPIVAADAPTEIAPALHALNGLFRRVDDARQRERSFTAFAAHELKTPLAGIKTQAQIALASDDADTKAHALAQIASGVDRSARLARQLLDLASVDAADTWPERKEVDLHGVLAGAASGLKALADVRAVSIDLANCDRPRIVAEPVFVGMAVRNVVENAIHHAPPGTTVRICLARNEETVAVIIEDEGPGMSDEELAHATERFYRGRSRLETGSGLGLAIVETVMKRCGGNLAIANRTPQGLRVRLTFDAAAA
ncbi:ATP-binding protein [Arvimicrobium flavum]|uniref:ATP-binding protein n=1 Tax=Arvimicrobium flavum TaxID=3393320 RepID=UPI00237A6E81|nr:ATP-binding protein [Mesorhizobium shangrilense]